MDPKILADLTLEQPLQGRHTVRFPTLDSSINAAPSLIPNILDTTAPNAQGVCPGYKASNVQTTDHGYVADLSLAGVPCNVYGNDILELSLVVEYQSQSRLSVKIQPRYLTPAIPLYTSYQGI